MQRAHEQASCQRRAPLSWTRARDATVTRKISPKSPDGRASVSVAEAREVEGELTSVLAEAWKVEDELTSVVAEAWKVQG